MALMAGWTVAREATGNLEDYLNGTSTNCTIGGCKFGLHNSFQVLIILFKPFIIL